MSDPANTHPAERADSLAHTTAKPGEEEDVEKPSPRFGAAYYERALALIEGGVTHQPEDRNNGAITAIQRAAGIGPTPAGRDDRTAPHRAIATDAAASNANGKHASSNSRPAN